MRTLGVPRASGRKRRRGRAIAAEGFEGTPLPLARYGVARPRPFESESDAEAWLAGVSSDHEQATSLLDSALAAINAALHAQRAAAADPYVSELSPTTAQTRRIGYGTGDEVADGRWTRGIEIAAYTSDRLQNRLAAIEPQERLAAILGANQVVLPCEVLILRAQADLDHGRTREAMLQLVIGVDALLGEVPAGASAEMDGDLEAITSARDSIGAVASSAISQEPDADQIKVASKVLARCRRVLSRRSVDR